MAVAAEQVTVSIIKEDTKQGVTPDTPAMLDLYITSESVAANPTFTESQMITGGTRGIPDSVMTQISVGGDLQRELVYEQTTNILFESLLGNEWGDDPVAAGIGADELYDSTKIISITMQKQLETDPSVPEYDYHNFLGMVAASGTIDFAPGQIITQNTTLIGLEMTTGELAGQTHVLPDGNSPMTAPRVTSIAITDVLTKDPVDWVGNACFTQLTLAFENNTRALACIGKLKNNAIALGRLNVSGSGEFYYNSIVPLESLLNETEYGLIIVAEDLDGNSYEFWIPRCKFTVATALVTGQSTDVMTAFTLQGLQAVELQYTVKFTRTAGPGPIAVVVPSVDADGGTTASISFPAANAEAGSVEITGLASGGLAITGLTPVTINEGDTGDIIAANVATMLDGLQDGTAAVTISATATGESVEITEAGGGNIDAGLQAVVT